MKFNFDAVIKVWFWVHLERKCTKLDILTLSAFLNTQTQCPGIEHCESCGDCGDCVRHPSLADKYKPKITGKEVLSRKLSI